MSADTKTLGQIAYKGYTDSLPWGAPRWDDLIGPQKDAWEAAANAVAVFAEG